MTKPLSPEVKAQRALERQANALVKKTGGRLIAPYPNSLVASAKRLTTNEIKGGSFRKSTAETWQNDAWEMYDLVGEQRFLATTLAGRVAKARLFIGKLSEEDPTADPIPVEADGPDAALSDVLEAFGDGPTGRAQMIQRLAINLFVAGDGWLVGIPKELMPDYHPEDGALTAIEQNRLYEGFDSEHDSMGELDEGDSVELDNLQWKMLSVNEVETLREGTVKVHLGQLDTEKIEVSPNDIYLIRVWRSHPRYAWEADSPTRSSLSVLRELVGLTMHISAQVDSRLAGAGILVVPESAVRAMKRMQGLAEDSPDDPFTDALIEAMLTPIGDRSNASALVPLVVVVPDDATDAFEHITFSKPLDTEARALRDEAIRRLALGQDAPPELLLGTGGMNHWGAWLVQEDVVTTHIVPPLELICDALTTQYLRPIMLEMGYEPQDTENYMVWYDVSHMIVNPNRGADAQAMHDAGVINDKALREANGFDDTDAPGAEETDGNSTEGKKVDAAALKALDIVMAMPQLMIDPGLEAVVAQVRKAMFGIEIPPSADEERERAAQRAAGKDPDAIEAETIATDATEDAEPADDDATVTKPIPTKAAKAEIPRPKFSLEQVMAAFDAIEGGREFVEGYGAMLEQNLAHVARASADTGTQEYAVPGLKKDGTPPKCEYCSNTATGYFLHAEGMAYVAFCEDHEDEARADAESATPDGTRDPSNIDVEGQYKGGWGTPSKPKPQPKPTYLMHPEDAATRIELNGIPVEKFQGTFEVGHEYFVTLGSAETPCILQVSDEFMADGNDFMLVRDGKTIGLVNPW